MGPRAAPSHHLTGRAEQVPELYSYVTDEWTCPKSRPSIYIHSTRIASTSSLSLRLRTRSCFMTTAAAAIAGARMARQRAQQRELHAPGPSDGHLFSDYDEERSRARLRHWQPEPEAPAIVFVSEEERERQRVAQELYNLLVSIPTRFYAGSEDGSECAICLTGFVDGQKVKSLPCQGRHTFHSSCLRGWFKQKADCPVCRFDCRAALATPPST